MTQQQLKPEALARKQDKHLAKTGWKLKKLRNCSHSFLLLFLEDTKIK